MAPKRKNGDPPQADNDEPLAAAADEEAAPKTTKSKGAKVPLMDSAEFTAKKRRKIRAGQRALQKEINNNATLIEDVSNAAFNDLRTSNNKFFDEGVRFVREAVIDGVNVAQIGEAASRQGTHLISTTNFNETKLIQKLRKKCKDAHGNIDWSLLGDAVGPCFNSLPFAQFFKGPFDEPLRVKEKRVARKKVKRVDEEGEEENPEDIVSQTKVRPAPSMMRGESQPLTPPRFAHWLRQRADGISGFENVLSSVAKKLRTETDKAMQASNKKTPDVSFPELVINPTSFTQTIENILSLGFMVKKGDASVKNDDSGLPVVHATSLSGSGNITARQTIVSLTMRDWRELRDAYDIEQPMIPDRKVTISGNSKKGRVVNKEPLEVVDEDDHDAE